MDKRKLTLLKYLLDNCSDGYKVVDTKKLLTTIKKYKNNYESLEKDIKYLQQMQYIDLKYMDNLNLCLCTKDNSRILQENLKIENGSKKQVLLNLILTIFISGVMSFVGAFLAIIITR